MYAYINFRGISTYYLAHAYGIEPHRRGFGDLTDTLPVSCIGESRGIRTPNVERPQIYSLLSNRCSMLPVPILMGSSDNMFQLPSTWDWELLAPQVGLEPTTYGLTVRRSNQLSYWGIYCWLKWIRTIILSPISDVCGETPIISFVLRSSVRLYTIINRQFRTWQS